MAVYANQGVHRNRNNYENVGHVDFEEKSLFEMETISEDSAHGRVNVFIVFVFILELLVLVFVSVLEYFLRLTDVFPVRHLNYSCSDPDISQSIDQDTFREFAYYADVPYEVVIPISFCLPPVLIIISEIALWAFTDEPQKTVLALCKQCRVPQVCRRMLRFIGAFLFGMLITMIITDISKIMTGRLRPTFLSVCRPNDTACETGGILGEDDCLETDKSKIRDARLSFPSLHASVTAFAAGYLAIYLHNVIRTPSVRIMRPFLSLAFVILSVLCCLARSGLRYNFWTDIAVGFILGMVIAIYIGVFVLNNFRERMGSQKLYMKLKNFMAEQRALELRDFYKENWHRLEHQGPYFAYAPSLGGGGSYYSSGIVIPRPHVHANGQTNESNTDIEPQLPPPRDHYETEPRGAQNRQNKYQQKNTFQRDLQRTLDQYRRGSDGSYHAVVHGHM